MGRRLFWGSIAIVLFIGVFLRIAPLFQNNFYFTVDQGRDAVYVREILNSHRVFVKGPETSVRGIFVGPLWYYFISLGYLVTDGHPAGGILPLVFFNILVLIILARKIGQDLGKKQAVLVVFLLLFSWWHYENSRWSFNPFPLMPIAILLPLVLKRSWLFTLGLIILSLNTNLAGAGVLIISTVIFNLICKRLSFRLVAITLGVVIFTYLKSSVRVFTGASYSLMISRIGEIITGAVVPQGLAVSLVFLLLATVIFLKNKNCFQETVKSFWFFAWINLLVGFVFLGASKIYRDWYTAYLPTLLYLSTVLVLLNSKNRLAKLLLTVIFCSQFLFFFQRYQQYWRDSDDPGILKNQLATVDWIYSHDDGQGFSAYVYTKSYYDYSYQYLFWWQGLKKRNYLPCQYAIFPNAGKEYVPGSEKYLKPHQGCQNLVFLIIDSDTNGNDNEKWIDDFRDTTKLLEVTQIGKIRVEKRQISSLYREFINENVIYRTYVNIGMTVKIPIYWQETRNGSSEVVYENEDRSLRVVVDRINRKCSSQKDDGAVASLRLSGVANDFRIRIYARGIMVKADSLIEEIKDSFRSIEDEFARPMIGCEKPPEGF